MKRQNRKLALVSVVALLWFGISAAAFAQNTVDLKVGDVLAAVGSGTYKVYDAGGNSLGSIVQGAGDTRGCANDSSYHPITTDLSDAVINRWNVDYAPAFGIANNAVISHISSAAAESLALDGLGNLYAGQPGGNGCVLKYDVGGNSKGFLPSTCTNNSGIKGGTAWIDLGVSPNPGIIYFGNGSSKTVNQFSASCTQSPAKCVSTFGPNIGTVFGVRVLTPDAVTGSGGSGYLLAAAGSQVALLDSSGNLLKSYTATGEKDFEVLTLLSGGTQFAAGSPAKHKIYVFNYSSSTPASSIPVGSSGPAGMCTYGLADAAQPQPQPANVLSCQPGASGTANLTPPGGQGCGGFTSNTAAFNVPNNTLVGNNASRLKVTFPDLSTSGSLTARVTTVSPASVPSDPTVISSNTLLSEGGNFACTSDGTNCYVWEVEPSNLTFTYDDVSLSQAPSVDANARLLKNEGIDVTYLNSNADPAGRSILSVYSLNEFVPNGGVAGEVVCPTGNGGYLSPVTFGQVYNFGRTVPFKFQVAASLADCAAGNFLTNLGSTAYLTMVLCSSDAASCTGAFSPGFAPATAVITVSGNSGAPPVYNQDTNAYHLNVDSSNLIPGACYAASTYAPAVQSISTAFCLTN